VNHPGFSPYGLIVYSREDNDGFYQLWRCSYDGSGQTQITTDASDHNNPSYSPDGTKIVYDNYSNIYTIPSGGGSPTLVGPGDDPAYNWDGLHILAITNTTPSSLISYPLFLESNPPSGVENPNSANKLAAMTFLTSPKQIWIYDFMSGRFAQTYASSPTFGMSQPALSPDGKQMAFVGANGSAAPSIYLSNSEGLNAYPILFSASTTETVSQPAWSPYFQPRSFVGTSGLMFTTASGFLWSTVGSGFGSCVSFQAQTPSTASITPQGSATTSSLVFLIQADSITNLKYTNAYYGAVSTPISASTTTPEALISFNSTTGAVEITIPFLETRAGKTVRASASGKNLVYSGTIPAIYNAKGQNIAPAGAHQVTIDPKTGKLVSWS
jgi:dipeptidyl aminopeptidase/acylaminoacyl peptidase